VADIHNPSTWQRICSYLIRDPLIYLYTVVLGTLSLLSSLVDRNGQTQHRIARLWARLILKTVNCPLTIAGAEHLDATPPGAKPAAGGRACVLACNHISALDIPVLYHALPFQFRIMAKRELFRYPFLGWHLRRSGQIPIERETARTALRSLRQASETVSRGMPLLVFPEGGRSANGRVQPFLGGAFFVAIRAGVPVVPMAIVGSFEAVPMNSFVVKPRPLTLVVGEPIATTEFPTRDMDRLAARVQKAVEDLYYARAEVSDPRGEPALPATPNTVKS
jgi:1-acyl-sn-glycerol-3-phosphate acyltransferase